MAASCVVTTAFTFTFWLAVRFTAPPEAPPVPSIWALTLTFCPAAAFSDAPVRVLSTAALMVTSRPAARSTRPVAPSMMPSTMTLPLREVALSDPPLMPRVVTSPLASMTIAWLPETSEVPAAIVAAPFVADRPMAPLLVVMELLTSTSRVAFGADGAAGCRRVRRSRRSRSRHGRPWR